MRTGSEIQLAWLKALTKRTERFLGQLPQAHRRRADVLADERPTGFSGDTNFLEPEPLVSPEPQPEL